MAMQARRSRRVAELTQRVWILVTVFAWGSPSLGRAAEASSVRLAIARAGNAEDEKVRFRILDTVLDEPAMTGQAHRDLQALLRIVNLWANNTYSPPEPRKRAAENGFLCGFFTGKVRPDRYLLPRVSTSSPLYPIVCLYRGRMLIHQVIQSGNLRNSKSLREKWCGEGRRLLGVAQKAFPENRIIGMYLDQPIQGWPVEIPHDDGAPEWANLQRESIEKLAQIIHWWIDHRQIETGEFGGGWGDDCEMWRWWAPVMIAFDDPKITAAQQRFSEAMFGQAHMKFGYTEHTSDVEHTAEDSKDTITPMLHLQPDNAIWGKRALRIADLAETVWMEENRRGTLQFKSTYFNVHKVDASAQRACDTVWHPGALQPVMLYALRTRDPRLTRLFSRWMDTWVQATAKAERGKPAGVIPSAVHWPEGHAGGVGKLWYRPEIDKQAHLYDWPGNTTMLTSTLLLAYHLSGNDRYLQPIRSMAEIRRGYLEGDRPKDPEPGSLAWCASKMRFMAETYAKYRALTGDTQFDDVLKKEGDGYVRFRLGGGRSVLTKDLLRSTEALRANWPGYTSEVRWTDRVMSFTRNYLNDYADPPLPKFRPALIYESTTGDMGRGDYLPLNAVRWMTPPKEIAAPVAATASDRFEAELYHFGSEPRAMGAEFYMLQNGKYVLTLGGKGKIVETREFEVSSPRTNVPFTLPPRVLCQLRVVKAGKGR